MNNILSYGRLTALGLLALLGLTTLIGCSDSQPGRAPTSEQVDVHTAPTGVKWTTFQGIPVPTADQGPTTTNGAVVAGFAHTPPGAALAAIQATVRISAATDTQWPLIGQQMLIAGPGRDAWATTRAQVSITTPVATGAPKTLGYEITGYTADHADVAIYTIHPDSSLTRNLASVVWQSEDWRLLLPEQPRTPPVSAIPIPPIGMVELAAK
ncbi:hypothetical protein ACQPW1_22385 [Nocardia sp. CA-128927]|uniref:hypothetical protein n=1 Tax=Nocardia sp. CA-128927 TaxID=3239975 RepID=UPI003D996A9A